MVESHRLPGEHVAPGWIVSLFVGGVVLAGAGAFLFEPGERWLAPAQYGNEVALTGLGPVGAVGAPAHPEGEASGEGSLAASGSTEAGASSDGPSNESGRGSTGVLGETVVAEECPPMLVVPFDRGANEPSSDAVSATRRFARSASHATRVVVRGHADNVGNELENLRLSHRRARRVAEVLAWHGVAEDRIVVQAFGEYQPDLEDGPTRRVEVVATCGGTP
ncbi:MAG: OmpA family protein [Sandaracinus sp.]|nr:OmpA family protein [Sandaracinus sp.]MCB9612745.1 OmpA family protein [Sandaracinus sp.]MCB9631766.1 OmpA family protein [Sandaracinus sp.]